MDTIKNKQNCIGGALRQYFFAFCALCIGLFAANSASAIPYEYEIQVDYSFDTGAVSGKEVTGYRLYQEDDPICDVAVSESQSFTCTVTGESGAHNFFLSALYSDNTVSPLSSSFSFTIPEIITTPIAPAISVNNLVNSLAENSDTTGMIKIAEVIVSDPDGGTNNLRLNGPDGGMFTIIDSDLYLKSGTNLDFEVKSSYEVIVEVDDPNIGSDPDDSLAIVITISDVNERPSVALSNIVTNINEGTSNTAVKVADIAVTDDSLGANTLRLSGPDANKFSISGSDLFLAAGTTLDFESDPILNVTVEVDDPNIAPDPDDSSPLVINISDVNERPSVALSNIVTSINEGASTNTAVKVADIVVTDDSLGTNTLRLSGSDANKFSISGSGLFLAAGTTLDFESAPVLAVTVEVDDSSFTESPDDVAVMTISIVDANEPPTISLANVQSSLSEGIDTSVSVKIADITIQDDALGTNTLSLSGLQADQFIISGTELYLKKETVLDYETNTSLDIMVHISDQDISATPLHTVSLAIAITDKNEAPVINLTNQLTSLAEDVDTSVVIEVADIVIVDDALGTNALSVAGPDAALFEIIDNVLCLKTGSILDFETNAVLDILVAVRDSSLTDTPEDVAEIAITITDVDETSTVLNAKITASELEGDAPFTLTLDALRSTGDIKNYFWSFGDNQTASNDTITHTYELPGTYNVTLTISDDDGAIHKDTIAITALEPEIVEPEPTLPPTAKITLLNGAGEAPLSVTCNSAGSTVDEQLSATYSWDFDDGNFASGSKQTHIFTTPGIYKVTLTVTDSLGVKATATSPVVVSAPKVENELPVSKFVIISTPDLPMTFTYDASQSSDSDGSISEYLWDFGDGSSATGMAAEYTYPEAGEYMVTLKVTDDQEGFTTSSQMVTVIDEDDETLVFELGEVQVGGEWISFAFNKSFVDPVIIASPMSFEDEAPATVRIRNVTQSGFEVRIQEWDYLDGAHDLETFSFIVFDKGVYTLESGVKIEVGSFNTNSTWRFKTLSMQQSYGVTPVVLTQVMTENETDALTVRLRRIDNDSFQYKLQEQEQNSKVHTTETIGYIAWEPGSGELAAGLSYEVGFTAQTMTHEWYNLEYQSVQPSLPFFFAGMQTCAGGNTSVVRTESIDQYGATIKIEEEQSKDDEVAHKAEEIVGHITLGASVAE